jgi:Uma2 family endonuclease
MSVISPSSLFGVPPLPTRKFTVAEYHRMLETGILTEDDAVELLEGWIVPKMPRKPPHDGTIQLIHAALLAHLPAGWTVRVQSALTTSDSEPEPDLAVVRGDTRTYLQRHPEPGDVGLVVEVFDTTLSQDRQEKGRLYARAALPHYWIVNLVDDLVEVYANPSGPVSAPSYRTRTDQRPPDTVPFLLDGQLVAALAVADLLP